MRQSRRGNHQTDQIPDLFPTLLKGFARGTGIPERAAERVLETFYDAFLLALPNQGSVRIPVSADRRVRSFQAIVVEKVGRRLRIHFEQS